VHCQRARSVAFLTLAQSSTVYHSPFLFLLFTLSVSRYGAYGSRALLPHFNRLDLPLLDRGFVLASAHVSLKPSLLIVGWMLMHTVHNRDATDPILSRNTELLHNPLLLTNERQAAPCLSTQITHELSSLATSYLVPLLFRSQKL
jgi:hypothetical protein